MTVPSDRHSDRIAVNHDEAVDSGGDVITDVLRSRILLDKIMRFLRADILDLRNGKTPRHDFSFQGLLSADVASAPATIL